MIDTHAHIQDLENIDKSIMDAIANGVDKMICVGYDIKSSKEAIDLAEKYDAVYAIIGVHPSEVEKVNDNYIITAHKEA